MTMNFAKGMCLGRTHVLRSTKLMPVGGKYSLTRFLSVKICTWCAHVSSFKHFSSDDNACKSVSTNKYLPVQSHYISHFSDAVYSRDALTKLLFLSSGSLWCSNLQGMHRS